MSISNVVVCGPVRRIYGVSLLVLYCLIWLAIYCTVRTKNYNLIKVLTGKNAEAPNEECETTHFNDLKQFLNYGREKGKLSCPNLVEVGRGFSKNATFDSKWYFSGRGRRVCFDTVLPWNCTMISITTDDHYFEDDVVKSIGCRMFVFYPLNHTDGFLSYHDKTTIPVSIGNGSKMQGDTHGYQQIIGNLESFNQEIDYLKLDIKQSDIEFLEGILKSPKLLKNVKQIGMKIYPSKTEGTENITDTLLPFWNAMQQLQCFGYDLISFMPIWSPVCTFTHEDRLVSSCFEIVNAKFPSEFYLKELTQWVYDLYTYQG